MLLKDLNTSFDKKRTITYGGDGNKVVYHTVSVQQISGFLYKSETRTSSWGDEECSLYVCYPNCPGLFISTISHFGGKNVEELAQNCAASMLDSPEHFIELLDRHVLDGSHIGNAQIELAKYLAPEKVEKYAAARQARYDRQKHKQDEDAAKRRAEQAEKDRLAKQEREAERATLLGWGDSMPELQLGRVLSILSARYRYDGMVKTRRQHIIDSIAAGYMPKRWDNVTSFNGSRWGDQASKPRTEYSLGQEGSSLGYRITKTEYDFATYLYNKKEKNQNETP